jgi:RHS repeat-associated protein
MLTDGTNAYLYGPSSTPFEQVSLTTDTAASSTFLVSDVQGSVRLQLSDSGALLGTVTYDANGNPSVTTGVLTTPVGYDGQWTDPDTSLVYLRARWYDPATAQFVSVDPLVARTLQAYGFADENPLNFGDLNGLCSGWNLWCEAVQPALHSIANSFDKSRHWVAANRTAIEVGAGIALGVVSFGAGFLATGALFGAIAVSSEVTTAAVVTAAAAGGAAALLDAPTCFGSGNQPDRGSACAGMSFGIAGATAGLATPLLPLFGGQVVSAWALGTGLFATGIDTVSTSCTLSKSSARTC